MIASKNTVIQRVNTRLVRSFFAGLIALTLTLGAAACADPQNEEAKDGSAIRGQLVLAGGAPGKDIKLELARSESERQIGLMYRKDLAPDHGMLFIFDDEATRSFWMKDTFVPLDMIFLNRTGEIVDIIRNAEPLTTSPRRGKRPAKYVLELKAGSADAFQLSDGARLLVPGVIQAP